MGFTFDDTDKKGVANPVSVMHDLIRRDPRNAERTVAPISERVADRRKRAIVQAG